MEGTKHHHFVSNNHNESPKLFQNKFLDALTRTHIAIPVSLFFIYAAGLLYYTKVATALTNLQVVGLFFGGWLAFTLAEYSVHRGIYHMVPNSEWRKKMSYTMHGIHHDFPRDKQRLAMPPALSIIVGTVLLGIFRLLMGDYAFSFLAGFLVGYASYLLVHYVVHMFKAPNNFFRALWTNHAIHHYSDPNSLFGVSSPLWDYVFRTLPEKKVNKSVEVKGGWIDPR